MTRSELITKIESTHTWDIIIIGGGASGLGAAVDASSRGYKTLLLEQYDYTIGTSSRSTKLIHGGVRYLEQGNISLVFDALKERGLLLRNAPHLVKNMRFIIPSYAWWQKPFYTLGLKFYDLLSKKLSFGKSESLSKEKTISLLPTLEEKGLRGSIKYHDGQFDDSRLGINLVQTIIENGGTALNYIKVEDFKKENGKINGVYASDMLTGDSYHLKAKVVLNATGVFVNNLIQKDNPSSSKIVKPSQGVHIVVDQKFLKSEHALLIPKTKDGRVLFAVPWHNRVILGTTDLPKESALLEPKATNEEIDFILDTAGRYLTNKPTRKDIKSVFAGLRPLVAPKENSNGKTKEISRNHKIIVSKSNLVTIIGGKWTIYREMGEDSVNELIKVGNLPNKTSVTENLRIHGFKEVNDFNNPMYCYGSDAKAMKSLVLKDPSLNDWVSEQLSIKKIQIVWAVRNEYAINIDDVLSRRTRALLLDAKESVKIAPYVANIMALELGYDKQWENEQVEKYIKLATNYMIN